MHKAKYLATSLVLPDGTYSGTMGGYIIDIKHEGKLYQLESIDYGIRGMGYGVNVTIKGETIQFN